MRKITALSMIALATASIAVPALAQKANGNGAEPKARSTPHQVPPGILVAAQHVAEGAGHGHGNDVPRGNGNGWGHLLHDHEPVSP